MILWIVIADGAGARIAEVRRLNDSPRLIHAIANPNSRAKAMDLVTDKRGPLGPTTEPKKLEAEEFARHLAAFLQKEFDVHHFESLAILAPAHFLGLLRAGLPAELEKAVVFEQSKELTYVQDSQLPSHLTEAIEASFREAFARTAVS